MDNTEGVSADHTNSGDKASPFGSQLVTSLLSVQHCLVRSVHCLMALLSLGLLAGRTTKGSSAIALCGA